MVIAQLPVSSITRVTSTGKVRVRVRLRDGLVTGRVGNRMRLKAGSERVQVRARARQKRA
eukprot:1378466-Amorphochlora_amoeboformis.AAC.1